MLAFLLHNSDNGGVATWTKFAVNMVGDRGARIIDNNALNRDLRKFSVKTVFVVLQYVKKNEIKVVVVGNSIPSIIIRLVKILYPLKIIYVTHGWGWSYQSGVKRFLAYLIEFLTIFLVDEIIAVSHRDQIIALKYFKRRSFLVPNVSMKDVVLRNDRTRHVQKVLFVGRNSYPKRLDLFEVLAQHFDDLDFYIVGAKKQDFMNLKYLGEVNNFNDYGSFDALILLSESEGSPLVLLEALEAGLICLVNRLDYLGDLEDDWHESLFVCNDLSLSSIKSAFELLLKARAVRSDETHKLMALKRIEWRLSIISIFRGEYREGSQ